MNAPVLSFSATSQTALVLSWEQVSGATNYTLQYRTSQSNGWTTLINTADTSYTHTVTVNTVYYYRISANSADEIVWSEECSRRTYYTTSLSVTATNETTITTTWAAITGIDSFKIERSTDNATWNTLSSSETGTSYADTSLDINTYYYYRVTPNADTGAGSASSNIGVFKILDLTATVTGKTSVQLTFVKPSAFTGVIYIQRSTDGTSWSNAAYGAGISSPYTDTGVSAGTTYYYRAYCNGNNYYTTTGAVTTPSSTSNFVVIPIDPVIGMTWDAVTEATSYNIERSTDNSTWEILGTSEDTDYFDDTVSAGTTYYYRLKTTVDVVNYWSDSKSAIILAAPATVTAVQYSVGTSSARITVLWSAVTGASNYLIERSTDGVTWATLSSSATGTSYSDTAVFPNVRYYYRVKANGSVYSTTSDAIVCWYINNTALSANVDSDGHVVLSWMALPASSGYSITRATSASGTYSEIATPTGTTYTDTDVSINTTYYYKIGVTGVATYSSYIVCAIGNIDVAPSGIILSNSEIATPALIGTDVGELSAIDANTGDTFTFSLVSGDGDTDNDKFRINGTTLEFSEASTGAGTYSIRVRVTDSANLTFETTFTITITQTYLSAPEITTTASYYSAEITFSEVTNATEYEAQYQTDGAEEWTTLAVSSLTATISGLSQGATVNVRVRAVSSDTNYASSEWVTTIVTTLTDTDAPVLTLSSSEDIRILPNGTLTLPTASATDAVDGNRTVTISYYDSSDAAIESIDTSVEGSYYVIYSASDTAGNTATERIDIVIGIEPLNAPSNLSATAAFHSLGVSFGSVSGTVSYRLEWKLSSAAEWSGADITTVPTTAEPYTISGLTIATSYDLRVKSVADGTTATDSDYATLTISTATDATPPVITLSSSAAITVEVGETVTLPTATATDDADGGVAVTTTIYDSEQAAVEQIDTSAVGEYTASFSATDSSGNSSVQTVAIHVVDTTPPTVSVENYGSTGTTVAVIPVGGTYIEYGATCSDSVNGTLTPVITGSVDTATAGIYTVTYTATDDSGNATSATRTVIVGTVSMEAAANTQQSIRVRWASLGGLAVNVQRRYNGSNDWATIAESITANSYTDYAITSGTRYYYRLTLSGADITGENLAWTLTVAHYSVVTYATSGGTVESSDGSGSGGSGGETTVVWATITEMALATTTVKEFTFMTTEIYRNEAGVFCARIADTNTGSIIQPSEVESITYTAYKLSTASLRSTRTAVTNHSNVSVTPADVMLEECITDSYWTVDETGYNFIHQPDIRTNPMFSEAGKYEVIYTILPTTGNPITLTYIITVS